MSRVSAIIVAAGKGKRFGSPKQFSLLKGRPVLDWSLEAFGVHEEVSEIVLVLEDDSQKKLYLDRFQKISSVVSGGKRRYDSVYAGFLKARLSGDDIVLVHDGVRPLVGKDLIHDIIGAARKGGAAVPVIPIEDTVKQCNRHRIIKTVDRDKLKRAQTPQGFRFSILKQAFEKTLETDMSGTDEAYLVEKLGLEVLTVHGEPRNIKITTQEDIKIAERFIED
jgi:2-C-methyl-D-erythritol 4-phosphate cytidylyltransferase